MIRVSDIPRGLIVSVLAAGSLPASPGFACSFATRLLQKLAQPMKWNLGRGCPAPWSAEGRINLTGTQLGQPSALNPAPLLNRAQRQCLVLETTGRNCKPELSGGVECPAG